MIMQMLARFAANRRSAVAVIMAISLVPLVLLVGIAVDFTFLYQSRTQTAFASEAAASQALRIAAATYQVEVANGSTSTQAAQHAITAANTAGNLWFSADAGTLIRTTLSSPSTNTTYDGSTTGAVSTSAPPNFSATVAVTGTYPPIFDPIFNSTTKWVYASNASATTTYSYAQILFMLDTSNSMLIGARQSDIQFMEQNTVCLPSNITQSFPRPLSNYGTGGNDDYDFASGVDNTWIGFTKSDPSPPTYYNATNNGTEPPSTATAYPSGTSPYQFNGSCTNGATPLVPCALACHDNNTTTFTNPLTGLKVPSDFYGFARANGVELRVDVLLSATEKAIQDMESSEAVTNQLSAGVYQFNADISTIARGNTNTGDALPEATSNLANALSAVQAVDYNHTPAETTIPVYIDGCGAYNFAANTQNCFGNTNLILSMQHLVAGKLPTDTSAQALTQAGDGSTAAKPLKFMFLVTDGMEGEAQLDGATDLVSSGQQYAKGEMTTLNDNLAVSNATLTPGTCTAIKKLGYTVYVLYVDYLPVSETQYYQPQGVISKQTAADFPGDTTYQQLSDAEPYIAAGGTQAQITANIEKNVPTAEALAQCASTTSDFYSAASDTDIQTALASMLKAALASTIRLTN